MSGALISLASLGLIYSGLHRLVEPDMAFEGAAIWNMQARRATK